MKTLTKPGWEPTRSISAAIWAGWREGTTIEARRRSSRSSHSAISQSLTARARARAKSGWRTKSTPGLQVRIARSSRQGSSSCPWTSASSEAGIRPAAGRHSSRTLVGALGG